jgi:hypothetical protein
VPYPCGNSLAHILKISICLCIFLCTGYNILDKNDMICTQHPTFLAIAFPLHNL